MLAHIDIPLSGSQTSSSTLYTSLANTEKSQFQTPSLGDPFNAERYVKEIVFDSLTPPTSFDSATDPIRRLIRLCPNTIKISVPHQESRGASQSNVALFAVAVATNDNVWKHKSNLHVHYFMCALQIQDSLKTLYLPCGVVDRGSFDQLSKFRKLGALAIADGVLEIIYDIGSVTNDLRNVTDLKVGVFRETQLDSVETDRLVENKELGSLFLESISISTEEQLSFISGESLTLKYLQVIKELPKERTDFLWSDKTKPDVSAPWDLNDIDDSSACLLRASVSIA